MSKHTKGKWSVRLSRAQIVSNEDKIILTGPCNNEDLAAEIGTQEYTANLILASKAPELLHACKMALDIARCADWPDDSPCSELLIKTIKEAEGN